MKENIIHTKKIGIAQALKNAFDKFLNSEWLAPDMPEDEIKLPAELLAVRAKWDGKEKSLGNRGEINAREVTLLRENIRVQEGPQIKKAEVKEEKVEESRDEFIK